MVNSVAEVTLAERFHQTAGMMPTSIDVGILVVGRDDHSRGELSDFLTGHGFRVLEACDRAAMVSVLQDRSVDVIILNDPSFYDGLGLCRELAVGGKIPIVMLADCEDATDRIIALEVGADEILARPFNSRELLARVRSLLRRIGAVAPGLKSRVRDFAGWRLDEETRVLRSPAGQTTQLAASEYALLKVFLTSPSTVVDAAVVSAALGIDLESCQANFRTSVCRLRRKLGKDRSGSDLLRTVHGRGYVLEASNASPA